MQNSTFETGLSQLEEAVTDMNAKIERLGYFSDDSNLAVNKSKTKWMLASTPQMDRVHSFDKKPLSLVYNGSSLERLRVATLLGVHLDNHLTWNEHITKTFSSCYSTLAVLMESTLYCTVSYKKAISRVFDIY